MKFAMYSGFSNMLCRDGIEKTAEFAVNTGYSAVEFFESLSGTAQLTVPDAKAAAKVKRELESRGLDTACYSAFANIWDKGSFSAPAQHTPLPVFYRALDIAAELGSPYFHHTMLPWLSLPADAPSFEDGIKLAVETASQIAEYAKPLGITCIYEDQGQYVNDVNGFGAFYWELKKNCNNVGVCGDFGNILFANVLPQPFLEAFKDEICHVHVKDYLQKSGTVSPGDGWYSARNNTWLKDTDIGTGIIDFKECLKILKSVGYDGYYAMEFLAHEPFSERSRQAFEYLKECQA